MTHIRDWHLTDGGLLRTVDGGKSWSVLIKQGAAPYKCFTEGSCHFFNANHGVANTTEFGLGNAYYRYFETHDGGTTWSPVIITSTYADNDLPPGTIHLCNLCGDRISYYPPTKVIITHGDHGDEQPKGAVRLSLSMNLGNFVVVIALASGLSLRADAPPGYYATAERQSGQALRSAPD